MPDSRETLVYQLWHESGEKLDFTILAATLAGAGYLIKTLDPGQVGVDIPYSLELVALIFLLAAVYCGFKRVEGSTTVLGLNTKVLKWSGRKRIFSHAASHSYGGEVFETGEELSSEEVKKLASQVEERHALREEQLYKAYMDSLGFYKRRAWYIGLSLVFLLLSKVVVLYV